MTQPTSNSQTPINTRVRDEIFKAVLAVLSSQGVGAFTMERVAETAGIAKGSIYNHFKNKDDLLRFVYRQTVEPIRVKVEQAIDQIPSAIEKIKIIVKMWFFGINENRAMFEFLIHDRSVGQMVDTVPDRARDICTRQAEKVFQEGIEEGEFRSDLPAQLLAEMLFGAAFDVVAHRVAREEAIHIEEIVHAVHCVFLEGVRPV